MTAATLPPPPADKAEWLHSICDPAVPHTRHDWGGVAWASCPPGCPGNVAMPKRFALPDREPAAPAPVERPGWDDYFLGVAAAVAVRADCRRRRVGAVLVAPDHRVLATGYNGAPAGRPGCLSGACPRGLLTYREVAEFTDYDNGPGRCISAHAEANALLHAGQSCRGATAYITDPPCPSCVKLLAAAGIVRAVWPRGECAP